MENCYANEQTQKTLRVYSGRAIGSHRHYWDSCRIFSRDNLTPRSALFPKHHWVLLRNLCVQSSTAVSHQENKVPLFGPEQDVNADSVISQTEHRTPFFGLKSRSTHPSMAAMAVTMNAGTTRVGMNV